MTYLNGVTMDLLGDMTYFVHFFCSQMEPCALSLRSALITVQQLLRLNPPSDFYEL